MQIKRQEKEKEPGIHINKEGERERLSRTEKERVRNSLIEGERDRETDGGREI